MLDGQASDPVPVLSGVPQGSVLGPVLFFIFINDLPENIRSSIRLFADDCVLYRNIKSSMDCQILQDDLNSLAQWETDWQMKSNVTKCHSMRVTRHPPDKHIQFDYTLHQQRLKQVQSAKYLGITITDVLDWGQHISEISTKATKGLYTWSDLHTCANFAYFAHVCKSLHLYAFTHVCKICTYAKVGKFAPA